MFGAESSKRIIIAWILYIQDDSKWLETIQNAILNFEEKMKKFFENSNVQTSSRYSKPFSSKMKIFIRNSKFWVLEHFRTPIT